MLLKIRRNRTIKVIKSTIIAKRAILLEIVLNLQKISVNLSNFCANN